MKEFKFCIFKNDKEKLIASLEWALSHNWEFKYISPKMWI